MIDVFGRDQYSLLGIASILSIEKIPYRFVDKINPFGTGLLLAVGSDLSLSEVGLLEQRPALVLNGGSLFATELFGAQTTAIGDGPCSIAIDQPIWSSGVARIAQSFGKGSLRIPRAPVCSTREVPRGTTKAHLLLLRPNRTDLQPAVAQRGSVVWSLADLGSAFAHLVTEDYLPKADRVDGAKYQGLKSLASRAPQAAYYAAPEALRRWAQAQWYSQLKRQLNRYGKQASEYPIDATGWLLLEFVKSLIKMAAGSLVRLARWPAPYTSAAAITHDVEPTRYAYTKGLRRLLNHVSASGHPATIGLVAGNSIRYIKHGMAERFRVLEVICHGLEHRGKTLCHGRARTAAQLEIARARLEHRVGHPVVGYRSPRLDRSPDLLWALDRSGFRYDSSYPDVDRENVRRFGAGVRVSFPYRPIVCNGTGKLKLSSCLELPVTAPDCIQPVFAGDTVRELRDAVVAKAAFLRATGGLYVAIVHGGVFGERDSVMREAHLDFVHGQLKHTQVWLANTGQITDWWLKREKVRLDPGEQELTVTNEGDRLVCGLRVILEHDDCESVLALPPLSAGAQVAVRASGLMRAMPLKLSALCEN